MEQQSTVLEKIALIIVAVAGIGAIAMMVMMGFILVKLYDLTKTQEAVSAQVVKSQQLTNDITRAMTTYATKQDMQNFADQNNLNLQTIQNNLSGLSAALTSVNRSTSNSSKQIQSNVSSTSTTPAPIAISAIDPYGYDKARQTLNLDEVFPAVGKNPTTTVPFGTVGFSAWQSKPWDINIQPREYDATTVIGVDGNDRQYAYNQLAIKVNDKSYTVPIKSSVIMQTPPTNTFSWFNPHPFITSGGAVNLDTAPAGDVNVGATVGFMSYGHTRQTPTLSLLQVGLGYEAVDKRPAIIFNPIMFNIGRMVAPSNGVISNTFIGPSFQSDIADGIVVVKAGANIAVGL